MSAYAGRTVRSIELPGVADREHLLEMLPQKSGQPLDRDQVRESIRILFATGRFADIQAEATSSGPDVLLTFTTSLNFFVGAVDVEGAPSHPNPNQILNATKFQLGELYTADKLNRALQNVRQLMQENGYYRARVTAESISKAATQQVNILFHITPGEPAHVGEVRLTGHSAFSEGQLQDIAKMHPGDRVTAARITNSLQRLRKKLQKQQRVLAQVSIAEQKYRPESNAVDFLYLIDPGPVVVLYTQGFHVSRSVLKREVPIYEENALDDDLLNEGNAISWTTFRAAATSAPRSRFRKRPIPTRYASSTASIPVLRTSSNSSRLRETSISRGKCFARAFRCKPPASSFPADATVAPCSKTTSPISRPCMFPTDSARPRF